MTPEQFDELKQLVSAGAPVATPPDVRSSIDKALAIFPVGSKTLTGAIGMLASAGWMWLSPSTPDADTTSRIIEIGAFLMSSGLSAAGLVAKAQRYINIAEQTLSVMLKILQKVEVQTKQNAA